MTDVIQAALSPGAHKEDLRDLDARLKQMVKSLPATVVYNPLMTALALLPFVIAPGPFGSIPQSNLVAAIGIQIVTSVVARMVYVTNRHGGQDLKVLQHELMAFQIFYSAGCGAVGWLCWSDYNPVNNMYIALMMVCVIWAGAFTRAAHRKIFIAGTITTALGYWSRFAIAPGSTALALTLIGPMWIAYIIVMGGVARKRVDEMLAVRFANEDLTDALRLARDDALRKRFEAEAANASKTIFLANMSHELRTPLNAILGFSDIIAEQSFGPAIDRYREYARDIHTSGAHLLSLINDLLDVAKIEAGKMEIDPQPIEPGQLLENVRRLMAPRALAKGLALEFTLSPEVKNPVADPRALKQIVLNLVSNSVKFTPHGGHISVDCGPATDGGFIVLVKDDGPGIPPEKLERVFKPFSQVDNRYDSNGGGTGLGLALVQGLAQLHGGRAWIESHVGAGTKVFVYFPVSDRFSKPAFRAAS